MIARAHRNGLPAAPTFPPPYAIQRLHLLVLGSSRPSYCCRRNHWLKRAVRHGRMALGRQLDLLAAVSWAGFFPPPWRQRTPALQDPCSEPPSGPIAGDCPEGDRKALIPVAGPVPLGLSCHSNLFLFLARLLGAGFYPPVFWAIHDTSSAQFSPADGGKSMMFVSLKPSAWRGRSPLLTPPFVPTRQRFPLGAGGRREAAACDTF